MNNPFELQMNKLKTNSVEDTNNQERNTSVNTQNISPLLDRRKKDNKQIYSVKLQKELSDKMITLAMEQNLSFTDIIEYGLEKVFEELNVTVNKDIVKTYNENKSKKK